MAKDPYKLLGVSKGATDAEIRKAYRALAKKMHPDVNPNDKKMAEKFKEISAAYSLLSDKNLRAQYDSGQVDASGQQQSPFGGGFQQAYQRGAHPGGQMGPGGFDDMTDLFASLFGMNVGGMGGTGGPRPGAGARRGYSRAQKGADLRFKLSISTLDAIKGGSKRVTLGGHKLDIKIPVGVKTRQVLRLRGQGKSGVNGGLAGDAKVEITVKADKSIRIDGKNILIDLPITLKEAVLGGKIKVPLPEGAVTLTLPAGTNSGKVFRLKGKGILGGDILVKANIVLTDPSDSDLKAWAEAAGKNSGDEARAALFR